MTVFPRLEATEDSGCRNEFAGLLGKNCGIGTLSELVRFSAQRFISSDLFSN